MENQFLNFIETGKDIGKAIKKREIIDTQSALRAKYPGIPIPTHRAIRSMSGKQQRAVSHQK